MELLSELMVEPETLGVKVDKRTMTYFERLWGFVFSDVCKGDTK